MDLNGPAPTCGPGKSTGDAREEYILPVSVDGAQIPGLAPTTGYLSAGLGASAIADLFIRKIAS